jgi:hypothetical protein
MDWTGGTRRRYAAKKKDAVAQKQKAYFVRARAALNAPPQHAMAQSTIEKSVTQSIRQPFRGHKNHSPKRHSTRCSLSRYTDSGTKLVYGASEAAGHKSNDRHHFRSDVLGRSRDRTSGGSARNQAAAAAKRQHAPRTTIPSVDGMSEEERLLLANRRRLLARSDWLGLAQFQPLSMKFSSWHDRDQIGKRRRVDNSRMNKSHPYEQRLLTPLLEERIRHPDFFMSSTLPHDNFDIKIGTDALGTQTQVQASRDSYMPANTSMEPPSTRSEPLSEESMLLDADEAYIDPLSVSDGDDVLAEAIPFETEHVCEVANMQRSKYEDAGLSSRACLNEQPNNIHSHDGGCGRQVYMEVMYENADEQEDERIDRNCDFVPQSPQPRSQQSNASTPLDVNDEMYHVLKQSEVDEDEDDDRWRRFLDVVQQIPSNASTKAVKSSSLHVTSSGDDTGPVLMREDLPPASRGQHELPSQSAEAPISNHDDDVQDLKRNVQSTELEQLQSPSVSLKCITDLANQPVQAAPNAYEQDKENALWRNFVCGAQEDSELSSGVLHIDQRYDKAASNIPTVVPASSSCVVRDLGTSNNTTIGGDTIVGEDSVDGIETDEIEDDMTVPAPSAKLKNIHAVGTLNPRRFLPPPKRQGVPLRRPSRLLPFGHVQTNASKARHSIFDIVDSNGNSLC